MTYILVLFPIDFTNAIISLTNTNINAVITVIIM